MNIIRIWINRYVGVNGKVYITFSRSRSRLNSTRINYENIVQMCRLTKIPSRLTPRLTILPYLLFSFSLFLLLPFNFYIIMLFRIRFQFVFFFFNFFIFVRFDFVKTCPVKICRPVSHDSRDNPRDVGSSIDLN